MLKRISRSPVIPYVGGTLIWAYMLLLAHTMRWRVEGLEHLRGVWEGPKGWVITTWHSRMLLMPYVPIRMGPRWPKPPHPPTLMVSTSRDGNFTNRAGGLLGLHIIRGSAPTAGKQLRQDKRGVQAARDAMVVISRGGGVVLTVDGPKGPPEKVGMGAIKLAQQVSAPIIIYGLSAHAPRMKTWDRLLFPKPFARGAVVVLPPIQTSKKMDSEELRAEVERQMKLATARADALAGLAPDTERPTPAASPSQPPAAADNALEGGGLESGSPESLKP